MSARLLLDEMFHPRIAIELSARGHDCRSVVAELDWRGTDDAELLALAVAERRVLVTNNVVDFERLRRQHVGTDQPVPPLIYTSDVRFPRDRRFIGRLVDSLDHACTQDLVGAAGGVLWLQPRD